MAHISRLENMDGGTKSKVESVGLWHAFPKQQHEILGDSLNFKGDKYHLCVINVVKNYLSKRK